MTDFLFTGPTGVHQVGLFSNTGAPAGNDLAFDNISLIGLPKLVTPLRCADGSYTWTDTDGNPVDPDDVNACV